MMPKNYFAIEKHEFNIRSNDEGSDKQINVPITNDLAKKGKKKKKKAKRRRSIKLT